MKRLVQLIVFTCFLSVNLSGQEITNLFNSIPNGLENPEQFTLKGEHTVLTTNDAQWENILSNHPEELKVAIEYGGETLELDLIESTFFRPDLVIRTSSGQQLRWSEVSRSMYYRGTFAGHPNSHFALSVLNEEIMGVGNIPGIGDVNLVYVKEIGKYLFYAENDLEGHNDFECNTEDPEFLEIEEDHGHDHDDPPMRDLGDCVGLYFEADHDIFLDKGSVVATTDYITAIFNEIYLLYDMDGMTVYLSDVLVWDTPSPYAGVTDTGTLLNLFGTTTPVWTGDLGHFVSYRGNGGLAWLDVFCHPDQALRKAVSDIDATFAPIPVFSWTIEVIAHEMGHNFGSPHTHACFWNGTMTAIDGCGPTAGYPEGCTAALPAQGTIMSYCHLVGGVGIDLGLGFGVQPGDHIRQEIIDATCLSGCDLNPFMDVEILDLVITSSSCEGDSIFSAITIQNNGNEDLTSLDIRMTIDGTLFTTYSWTGLVPEDSTEVIDLPGMVWPVGVYTYEVAIENPNGVEDEVLGNNDHEITFSVTPYPEVTIDSFTDLSCFGAADGEIAVTATGGTPGYTYSWDNGGGDVEDPVGLDANTYTLTLTDDAGCEVQVSQELTAPAEIVLDLAVTTTPDCFEDATGVATVSASGGAPGYTYLWSTGETGTTASGLANGDYTITVTDANGCDTEDTLTVTSPPEIIADEVLTMASCGVADGAIDLTVSGGVPGFTFAWETGATSEDLPGVMGGDYELTITDASGCLKTVIITVPEEPAPEIVLESVAHIDCFGDAAGEAFVSGINITGTPSYDWSTGTTGTGLTGVTAGEYWIVLSDASSCVDSLLVSISEGDEIIVAPTVEGVSCTGDDDGEISVVVSGGTPGYTYAWSTGEVTALINDLDAGTYTLTITDLIGCEQEWSIELEDPEPITIDAVFDHAHCGDDNGFIDLEVSGGTPGYIYNWSTGATTSSIDGLEAGIYNVMVLDTNGCFNTYSVVLDATGSLETAIESTNVACYGDETATGTVTVIAGEGPYTYEWSDGQITPTAVDLGAGVYTVLVTDDYGCTDEHTIVVDSPEEIEVASSVSNEVFGGDGQITVSVVGGVPAYTYLWNTGDTDEDLYDLVAGTYTLTVTDANGCEQTVVFVVDSQLSLEELLGDDFKVYPNPAANWVNVQLPDDITLDEISLYNAAGQLVRKDLVLDQTTITIDVTDLASGLYFMVVQIDTLYYTTEILVRH